MKLPEKEFSIDTVEELILDLPQNAIRCHCTVEVSLKRGERILIASRNTFLNTSICFSFFCLCERTHTSLLPEVVLVIFPPNSYNTM